MNHELVSWGSIIGHDPDDTRQAKVKLYDFKRPDKFSKEQIRTVSIMHETFARLASTSMSGMLRMQVDMHVASVDQMTFEEFLASIPNPTTMDIVNMDPLKGSAILEIDPCLQFAFMERLFGGVGDISDITRDLTNIECALTEQYSIRLLGCLRESWSTIVDLRPRLGQIETNPQFALIVPPTEMIVLITVEVTLPTGSGMINFCVPYLTIEPLISKLSAMYWYSSVRRGTTPAGVGVTSRLSMETQVSYTTEKLSLMQLGSLKKGSLVELPEYGKGRAYLSAGGKTVAELKRTKDGESHRTAYDIDTHAEGISNGVEFLAPGSPERVGEELVGAVSEPISELATEIKSAFSELSKQIKDMNVRQDEIVDEMLFSAPERTVPDGTARVVDDKPFSFVSSDDNDLLAMYLMHEHPQCSALILSYLSSADAAYILSKYPDDVQPDVARRIATLDRTAPEVLREIERGLEMKLKDASSDRAYRAGGISTLVEMLNLIPRSVEKNVIEAFERSDADFAEQIKMRMFVFEDIVLLSDDAVAKVLNVAEEDDLVISMKAVEDQVKTTIFSCMEEPKKKRIADALEALGSVKLADVEAAQQRVVTSIRVLEENGEIVVARADEMIE